MSLETPRRDGNVSYMLDEHAAQNVEVRKCRAGADESLFCNRRTTVGVLVYGRVPYSIEFYSVQLGGEMSEWLVNESISCTIGDQNPGLILGANDYCSRHFGVHSVEVAASHLRRELYGMRRFTILDRSILYVGGQIPLSLLSLEKNKVHTMDGEANTHVGQLV